MIESRGGASLAAKAFQGLRISRQFIRQELEGHETAKLGVLGLVNHAHAATTKFLDNAVVRDGLVNHLMDTLPPVASSYGRSNSPSTKRQSGLLGRNPRW